MSYDNVSDENFDAQKNNQEFELVDIVIPEGETSIFKSDLTFDYGITSHVNNSNKRIKSVAIPNGMKQIGDGTFMEQELTEVSIPSTMEIIGSYSFMNNNIKNITLPNVGAFYIGTGAFSGNDIDENLLPSSMRKYCSFYYCNCKFVAVGIEMKDFLEFKDDIIKNQQFFLNVETICLRHSVFNGFNDYLYILSIIEKHSNIRNIVIYGDDSKLSLMRVGMLAKFPKLRIRINYNLLKKYQKRSNKEAKSGIVSNLNEIVINDQEINKIINNIYNLIEDIRDVDRKNIIDKINKLVCDYQEKIKKVRPKYSLENDDNILLSVAPLSLDMIKNEMLVSLQEIEYNIVNKKSLIELSKNISKYKELLKGDVISELVVGTEIDDKIKNIMFISKKIDNCYYKTKLEEIIDEANLAISKQFDSYGENDISLSFEGDIKLDLNVKIELLYSECLKYYDNVKEYFVLLDKLNNIDNSELSKDIKTVKDIISKSDAYNKQEIIDKFNNLLEKYISLTKKNISDIDNNKKSASDSLELSFREELQPLLEKINVVVNKSKVVKNVLNQSKAILNYLETGEKVNLINGSLCEVAVEIELLLSDNAITESEKKDTIEKMKSIINYWIDKIVSKGNDDDFDNTNKLELEILKELYGLKFKLESYISRFTEYNDFLNDKRI